MNTGHILIFKFISLVTQFLVLLLALTVLTMGCTTAQKPPYPRDIPKTKKTYQVKKGDTLYSIGVRSGYDYKHLARWNKLSPPYSLKIGQTIKLFKPKKSVIANNKKILKLRWQWPIKGKILKTFSQTDKKGIDISVKVGQKVKSASAGKVVYSGLMGYHKLLIIKHNNLFLSAYSNNIHLLVKEGQWVKKGQVIAKVDRLGGQQISLHFEIRKNGTPVNPLKFLPKK